MLPPVANTVIRGWLSSVEEKVLAEIAAGKVVLEIGSFCGKSTVAMARRARMVYAVDWHRGDPSTDAAGGMGADTLGEFWGNVAAAGLRDRVVPIVGRTQDLAGVIGASWADVAFVDGCHLEDSVVRDLGLVVKCLKPGGVVAMHDWDRDGVRVAWRRAGLANRETAVFDTLAVHYVNIKKLGPIGELKQ